MAGTQNDRSNPGEVFEQLMAVIESRRDDPPARSYTTSLFQGGVNRIGNKVLEEAREVVDAGALLEQAQTKSTNIDKSVSDLRAQVIHEAGDVIYHLFVLLGHADVPLSEVAAELARRFGTSGLDEKAARLSNEDA